jgi:hypothetical protein
MKTSFVVGGAGALALAAMLAGCQNMDRQEKGMAIGATSGAAVGAAVGGPVGAAVGGAAGAIVGHEGPEPGKPGAARTAAPTDASDQALVRSVQESLNARGYNAGPADGQWGPNTESALREFQQANGLAQTGRMDSQTLSKLGVSR